MSAHTPGPWKSVPVDGEFSVRAFSEFSEAGRTIVHVGPDCVSARGRAVCSGEAKANAGLIAAAPDLLAALERVLPVLERRFGKASEGVEGSFIDEARAAIAKATGGGK